MWYFSQFIIIFKGFPSAQTFNCKTNFILILSVWESLEMKLRINWPMPHHTLPPPSMTSPTRTQLLGSPETSQLRKQHYRHEIIVQYSAYSRIASLILHPNLGAGTPLFCLISLSFSFTVLGLTKTAFWLITLTSFQQYYLTSLIPKSTLTLLPTRFSIYTANYKI